MRKFDKILSGRIFLSGLLATAALPPSHNQKTKQVKEFEQNRKT